MHRKKVINRISWVICLLLVASVLTVLAATPASTETEAAYRFFFGSFHNHHYATDGADDGGHSWDGANWRRKSENNALKAYETARKNGCDFYAVTPHTINLSDAAYSNIITAAEEINKKYPGTFVALYGYEWGHIRQGNHVNVLGAKDVCRVSPTRFDLFYEQWLPEHQDFAFVQFNHPRTGIPGTNYGSAIYEKDILVAKSDSYVRTMAAMTGISQSQRPAYKVHVDSANLAFFINALNDGWHLAPVADEDNHRDDWGGQIASRTVVIAPELTEERIYEAVKNLRVYASEDDEMQVTYTASIPKSGEKWMGSRISCPAEETEARFTIKVDQAKGMDNDPVDEGQYLVKLYGDTDGVDGDPAEVVETTKIKPGEVLQITMPVKKGQYYFLHVQETSGKDNGGENDDAYTSPIWFE